MYSWIGCFHSSFLPPLFPLSRVWFSPSLPYLPPPTPMCLSGSSPSKILSCVILSWQLLLEGLRMTELTPPWSGLYLSNLISHHLFLIQDHHREIQTASPYFLVFAHAPLPQHHPTSTLPIWLMSQYRCHCFWRSLSSVYAYTHTHPSTACLCSGFPEHSSQATIKALLSLCCVFFSFFF